MLDMQRRSEDLGCDLRRHSIGSFDPRPSFHPGHSDNLLQDKVPGGSCEFSMHPFKLYRCATGRFKECAVEVIRLTSTRNYADAELPLDT